MGLHIEIDGELFPLADCDWVMWEPCGCPCGVTMAETGSGIHTIATEGEAWRQFFDTKREITKAQKDGLKMTVIPHASYGTDVFPLFVAASKDGCPHKAALTP